MAKIVGVAVMVCIEKGRLVFYGPGIDETGTPHLNIRFGWTDFSDDTEIVIRRKGDNVEAVSRPAGEHG